MDNAINIDAPSDVPMSVLRAEMLRLGKGLFQMEVAMSTEEEFEYESEQLNATCEKSKGHEGYFSIGDLTVDHLPEGWRHPEMLATVKQISLRTVRLFVSYTNPDRKVFAIPCAETRRRNRVGSGFLISNISNLLGSQSQTCPISDCSKCSNTEEVSGYFVIQTAAHVVYDDSEAAKTSVEFFYDCNAREKVMRAQGVRVLMVDLDKDVCFFSCVKHDKDWRDKMKPLQVDDPADLSSLLAKLSMQSTEPRALGFVVSHPHGRPKRVTFGKLVTQPEWSKSSDSSPSRKYHDFASHIRSALICQHLVYDIPTCSGSSGAPVIVIHFVDGVWKIVIAAHSQGQEDTQTNRSAYGLEKLLMDVKASTLTPDQETQEMGTYQEQYDLDEQMCKDLFDRCELNPGHGGFIPVTELTVNHLPVEWRHPDNVAMIKHMCTRTVRLVVGYTSLDRPVNLPFADMRGSYASRIGTGFLVSNLTMGSQDCPLRDCSFSENPHKVSSNFIICTVPEIVYDKTEAQLTTAEFFFDDENNTDLVMKAWGVDVLSVESEDYHVSFMTCFTHDLHWRDKLRQSFHKALPVDVNSLLPALNAYPKTPENTELPLLGFVSHPHGVSKRVSFGTWPEEPRGYELDAKNDIGARLCFSIAGYGGLEQHINTIRVCRAFQYNVPICEGSEGALVTFIRCEKGRWKFLAASHNRCLSASKTGVCGMAIGCDISYNAVLELWNAIFK